MTETVTDSANDTYDELYKLTITTTWECRLIQIVRGKYIDGDTPVTYKPKLGWLYKVQCIYC